MKKASSLLKTCTHCRFGLLIILALLVAGLYFSYKAFQFDNATSRTTSSASPHVSPQIEIDKYIWKSFRFKDATGFGYEIQIPDTWIVHPFGGRDRTNPDPLEIAKGFTDENNCWNISIVHEINPNFDDNYQNTINVFTRDNFMSYLIRTEQGKNIEVWKDPRGTYYSYFKSTKGNYSILGHYSCSLGGSSEIYEKILSTFKFLKSS